MVNISYYTFIMNMALWRGVLHTT